MKVKNKKRVMMIVGVVIIAMILIIAVVVINNSKKRKVGENGTNQNQKYVTIAQDGTKTNSSKKLLKDKKIEGLKVTNISLTGINNTTTLKADIENHTNKTVESFACILKLLDENEKTIVELNGIINTTKSGEITSLNVTGTTDFSNAYDFEIIKK